MSRVAGDIAGAQGLIPISKQRLERVSRFRQNTNNDNDKIWSFTELQIAMSKIFLTFRYNLATCSKLCSSDAS